MTASPKKMKYTIRQIQPANQVWYYEVESESEELALGLVMSGELDAIEYRVDEVSHDEVEFEVIDVDDIEEAK